MTRTRLILAAALIAIGFAAWQMWPSDARRIRRKLDAIAATVNERPADGVAQLARTMRLSKFVTDDVVLEPGGGTGTIRGRERLIALASRAPNDADPFTLSFSNVWIDVAGDSRALVRLTATFRKPDPETGGETIEARDVELEFTRSDDWRIGRITLIDVPENPS